MQSSAEKTPAGLLGGSLAEVAHQRSPAYHRNESQIALSATPSPWARVAHGKPDLGANYEQFLRAVTGAVGQLRPLQLET